MRLDVVLVSTGIFTNVNRETKPEDLGLKQEKVNLQEMLDDLSKSFSLLATSSHELDLHRRRNFKSELKDINYKTLCAYNYPVTQLLF